MFSRAPDQLIEAASSAPSDGLMVARSNATRLCAGSEAASTMPRRVVLIRRGFFRAIDHQHTHRALYRIDPKTQLFPNSCQYRRTGGRIVVFCKIEFEIVLAGEVRSIRHRALELLADT